MDEDVILLAKDLYVRSSAVAELPWITCFIRQAFKVNF